MSNITLLSDIIHKTDINEEIPSEDEMRKMQHFQVREMVLDFNISNKRRLQLFKLYHKIYHDEIYEILSTITQLYYISNVYILYNFLQILASNEDIDPIIRIEACRSLIDDNNYNSEKNLEGFSILNNICKKLRFLSISSIYKIESLKLLLYSNNYIEECIEYFTHIINDDSLEIKFRYNTILSIETMKKSEDENRFFIVSILLDFFSFSNDTYYRILSGQYILINNKKFMDYIEKKYNDRVFNLRKKIEFISSKLLDIGHDESIEYNRRADAADIVLSHGATENDKKMARKIITSLGSIQKGKTIFENMQNVHVTEIEKSVLEIVVKINDVKIINISGNEISIEYIQTELCNIIEQMKKFAKDKRLLVRRISKAFDRIYLDRNLYSIYKLSLKTILLKLWSYMDQMKEINEETSHQMKIRLIEELSEMYDTCSSGFLARLINSISGFGEFNISISWEDQIIANFIGRLNSRINDILEKTPVIEQSIEDIILLNRQKLCTDIKRIDDAKNEQSEYVKDIRSNNMKINECLEKFYDGVLSDISSNCDYSNKIYFKLFLRIMLPSIKEEMYNEFNKFMSDTDFDLYMRKAIMKYEMGEIY